MINACRPDPCTHSVSDIVFAWCETWSDSKWGKVDKLIHLFTGPWCITCSLSGASYKPKFASNSKRTQKKHSSDLLLYPPELIPFEPLDIADSRYGQLYKSNGNSPFKEAGIKGFEPPTSFKVASHFLTKGVFFAISTGPLWPSSTTRFSHSRGLMRPSACVPCLGMMLMLTPFFTLGHHLCLFLTVHPCFLTSQPSSQASLTRQIRPSSFCTHLVITLPTNGDWSA